MLLSASPFPYTKCIHTIFERKRGFIFKTVKQLTIILIVRPPYHLPFCPSPFIYYQNFRALRAPYSGFWASPPSHPFLMGTEANANRRKGGDRSTQEQTKRWGQKPIGKNKGVGTEAHTNKTQRWGQKGDTHTNGKTKSMQLYNN